MDNKSLTNVQLEKFLHGAQLKSYSFNLYKTDKKKNKLNISLSVVGSDIKQKNILRNKLNSFSNNPVSSHLDFFNTVSCLFRINFF